MGLQPRRPAPKVEPRQEGQTVTGFAGVVAAKATPSLGDPPQVEPQQTIAEPRCRTYDGSGAHRCIKALGHVGAGDTEHEFEAASE